MGLSQESSMAGSDKKTYQGRGAFAPRFQPKCDHKVVSVVLWKCIHRFSHSNLVVLEDPPDGPLPVGRSVPGWDVGQYLPRSLRVQECQVPAEAQGSTEAGGGRLKRSVQ